jgi:small subunit ribosomal protein S17e
MGRIKTMRIKRVTNKLVAEHRKDFKEDFVENKKLVEKYADIPSKKLRNIIAGYVTRLIRAKEEI